MKTWDDWSDGDLSESVAGLYVGGRKFTRREKNAGVGCFGSSGNYIGDFDINNWADMGPLIHSNNIWLQPDCVGDGKWHCYLEDDSASHAHKSPLRAAAIAFLMMNGVKP